MSVGLGLIISGIATYGYLSITKRALGEDQFAPVSMLWFLTFILAPGFFLPVEQEVGRAIAHRRALGQGSRPVVQRAAVLEAILLVTITIVMLAISPLLVSHLFDGYWSLFVALLIAFWTYALAHLTRGVWSGTGRFDAYATLMGSEGLTRLIFAIVLAVVGVKAVGPYGILIGLPAAAGVLISMRGQHHVLEDGPEASWGEITPNLGWLLLGSVFAAALLNAGPIAASLLKSSDADNALVTQIIDGRDHRPGAAVPVPGGAGGAAAQAGPSRRSRRSRRLRHRVPQAADARAGRRRGRRCSAPSCSARSW